MAMRWERNEPTQISWSSCIATELWPNSGVCGSVNSSVTTKVRGSTFTTLLAAVTRSMASICPATSSFPSAARLMLSGRKSRVTVVRTKFRRDEAAIRQTHDGIQANMRWRDGTPYPGK